jgi:sterol desaturase/sphingolipid hydroxylase (fatty acid hydroxylase superfamily)
MNLPLSAKITIGTFFASTFSAYFICWFYKVPFFNPNQNRYQFYSNLHQVLTTSTIVLSQAVLVNSFMVENVITNEPHTLQQNVINMVSYSVMTEFLYYIYHRIIHTKRFYKSIHSIHHQNINVYPFDTFFMTTTDSLFLVSCMGVPILFLRMNYFENIFSLYIYITAAYIEHSNLLFTHHSRHHKLIFCNYCILNPIFDLIVGTYSPHSLTPSSKK